MPEPVPVAAVFTGPPRQDTEVAAPVFLLLEGSA
jgi:hypothetical protein